MTLLCEEKSRTHKKGSELSNDHLRALNVTYSSIHSLILEEGTSHLLRCSELLRKYSDQMRTQKMNREFDEVKYVQPFSRILIQDLFKVMIPDHYDDLVFVTGEKVATNFHTSIQLGGNQWVDVNGRTDISVFYRNVCIFLWEDKNLDKSLNTAPEICQIAVEVKGFAEDFKSNIGVEAQKFCGVETSGLIWSFCTRFYRQGNIDIYSKCIHFVLSLNEIVGRCNCYCCY